MRLDDIYSHMVQADENEDESVMLNSEKPLKPKDLLDIVPNLLPAQALMTLSQAKASHAEQSLKPVEYASLEARLKAMRTRVDYMLMCSIYVGYKCEKYKEQEEILALADIAGAEDGPSSPNRTSMVSHDSRMEEMSLRKMSSDKSREEHESDMRADQLRQRKIRSDKSREEHEADMKAKLAAVKQITQDRAAELAEGIASVLGEEMHNLERRQKEQRKKMDLTLETMKGIRRTVHKLEENSKEVEHLALHMREAYAIRSEAINNGERDTLRKRNRASLDNSLYNHRFSAAVGGTRGGPRETDHH